MNLPNILTLSRIVMIPVFVAVFYLPVEWRYVVSAALFAVAGATDWLDGYLARKLNQSTPFGAFLDPVADKLMVAVALTVLIEDYATLALTLPAMVIIGREIVISALSTDSKSIWEKIEAQLPTFALFKADRESSDGDPEAKNPLQQAVKDALPLIGRELARGCGRTG